MENETPVNTQLKLAAPAFSHCAIYKQTRDWLNYFGNYSKLHDVKVNVERDLLYLLRYCTS